MNICVLIFFYFCFVGFFVVDGVTEEILHKVAASLQMFVDELPDMPKLEGYHFKDGNLKPAELRIGMFQTNWVYLIMIHIN